MFRLSLLCLSLISLAVAVGCKRAEGAPETLPELAELQPFSLVDQRHEPFTEQQLRGKVWIAAFMFTRCPTICPRMMARMRDLQESSRQKQLDINFLSFSVDPENDTPAVLSRYAKEHGARLSNWTFATGAYDEIKRTSVEGFKLALEGSADPAAADFGILHSSYLILIDRNLRIRGYYSTEQPGTMAQLLKDAATL